MGLLTGRGDHITPRAGAEKAEESRKETNRFRQKNDPINRKYNCARWKKFRLLMLRLNPICARLKKNERGVLEQCHNPSVVCHHIVSPRVREDLFLVASNTRLLCERCHPTTEGDCWVEGVDVVKTILPNWHF
jgi:hypothetical protein